MSLVSNNGWRRWPPYLAVMAAGWFLFFTRLDSHLLWGDEAETANLARNVAKYGAPRTFDGQNRISIYGAQNDSNAQGIWTWSPWLQEYVAAVSFRVFGVNTWSARAAFALIGWLSLGFIGWVAYRIYRNHGIALGSMALLASSEVFLLHARQCRYYSISVLAQIFFVYGLFRMLVGDRRGAWITAGALITQFYSNYIMAVADLPVFIPLAWTLYRQNKRQMMRVVICLSVLGVAAAPWVLYAKPWHQSEAMAPEHHVAKLLLYLRELHFHFLPWVFLLLPFVAWVNERQCRKRKDSLNREAGRQDMEKKEAGTAGKGADFRQTGTTKATRGERALRPASAVATQESVAESGALQDSSEQRQGSMASVLRKFEWHLLFLIPPYLILISIAPGRFARYQLPLVPMACLLMAAWLFRYVKWRWVAIGVLGIQCLTNLPAMVSGWPWRGEHTLSWQLPRFIAGISQPYVDRFADVVAFFNTEAAPGDRTFVFDPEFPLIFYTKLRIIDGRLMAGLPDPLPDWLLPESPSGIAEQRPGPLPDVLKPYYNVVTFPVHNSTRRASMPDPDYYQYRTADEFSTFTVFRKKRAEP